MDGRAGSSSVPTWTVRSRRSGPMVPSAAMPLDFVLTEEQKALVATARDFTRKEIIPVAGRYDESGDFPRDVLRRAWETGLMNAEVPEAYGGVGLSCLDHCLLQEEIGYGCTGFNTSLVANNLA